MVGFTFFKCYFEKKWVGWAMGNKTIYWDSLRKILMLQTELHNFYFVNIDILSKC